MSDAPTCGICGEPMPPGEEMFKYHGLSGPCPKPPLKVEEPDDASLSVEVIGGRIVIAIGVRTFAHAVQFAPRLERFRERTQEYERPKITDALQFAKEVVGELCQEEEDGTTPVHRMLDQAASDAIDNGAEGVELP
jgi:hypothetical protein